MAPWSNSTAGPFPQTATCTLPRDVFMIWNFTSSFITDPFLSLRRGAALLAQKNECKHHDPEQRSVDVDTLLHSEPGCRQVCGDIRALHSRECAEQNQERHGCECVPPK